MTVPSRCLSLLLTRFAPGDGQAALVSSLSLSGRVCTRVLGKNG